MREKVIAVGKKRAPRRGCGRRRSRRDCAGSGGERGPAQRVRRVALWLTAATSRSERERLAAHYHNPALSLRDVIQSRERR